MSVCSYVRQDDRLLATATVTEALMFSINTRLAADMSQQQKTDIVDSVIEVRLPDA